MKNKLSLSTVSKVILKNLLFIIVMTLLFGLVGGLYARHEKKTTYESTRSMVTSHTYKGSGANEEVQADINLSKTYADIVESRDVAKIARHKLSHKLQKDYTTSKLQSMVNAHPVMETTIVKIAVRADSAKDSSEIVNAVAEAAAEQIPQKVPTAGQIKLFAKAVPSEANSTTKPSTKKYALLGSAIGFLFSMLIAFSITTWTKLV